MHDNISIKKLLGKVMESIYNIFQKVFERRRVQYGSHHSYGKLGKRQFPETAPSRIKVMEKVTI